MLGLGRDRQARQARRHDDAATAVPRTVRALQREILSHLDAGWEHRLDPADVHNGAVVFQRLPGGAVGLYVHASGERLMPRSFASEAEAVAFAHALIYGYGAESERRVRRRRTEPLETVEDLKDAIADLGGDPDDVGRWGLRTAAMIEGVVLVESIDDGSVNTVVFERGSFFDRTHYPSEAAFVRDYLRHVPETGQPVTDLDVARARARARCSRRDWEDNGPYRGRGPDGP